MRTFSCAVLLLLSGCAPALPAQPLPPPPRAFSYRDQTPILDFVYSWSAEAAAAPALAARFTAEMRQRQAELVKTATLEKAFRDKEGYPFNRYSSTTAWVTAGRSDRLLSLAGKWSEYTGGAHGNYGTRALLWDRATASEVKFARLFVNERAAAALLGSAWCTALDAARREKRQGETLGSGLDQCPALDDLALVPADSGGDGRFEQVAIHADPYVAGPYVEGSYEARIPVTPAFVAALKPGYRASFEAQPQ